MRYVVIFVPKLKDLKNVKLLLDALSLKDETFSYIKTDSLLSFDDEDKSRAFRRAMWIKEKMSDSGIELNFTFAKFKEAGDKL